MASEFFVSESFPGMPGARVDQNFSKKHELVLRTGGLLGPE